MRGHLTLLVLWGLGLSGVWAVTPVYDETLWTKQLWHQWKLDSSQFSSTPHDGAGLVQPHDLLDTIYNSLTGPHHRVAKQLTKNKAYDADAFDDDLFLPAATMAVKCAVCNTLVSRVWQRLVHEVLRLNLTVSGTPFYGPKYLEEACENEVVSLLQHRVIRKVAMEASAHAVVFFVLRQRLAGTRATHEEHAAVHAACQELLSSDQAQFAQVLHKNLKAFKQTLDDILKSYGMQLPPDGSPGDSHSVPVPSQAAGAEAEAPPIRPSPGVAIEHDGGGHSRVQQLLKVVAVRLQKEVLAVQAVGGEADALVSATDEGAEEDEYEDPDEEGFDADESCMDLHPMCEQWANEGECAANPAYMVGNARLKGHCLKSCGICTPRKHGLPLDLLEKLPTISRAIRDTSVALLKVVRSQACTSRQACLGPGQELASHGNIVTVRGKGHATPVHGYPGADTGHFVLGQPSFGEPILKEDEEARQAHEQRMAADQAAAQAAAEAAAASTDGASIRSDSSLADLQHEVDAVLGQELGGKLLQLHDDFFTFEYLYKNYTGHFHDEPRLSGQITEQWSLGSFARESVVVEAVLEPLDLLPSEQAGLSMDMTKYMWHYVKQVYAKGDVCTLGGGRTAVRRTEVRIACSPDDRWHWLIREPDFCHYVFVIYSPALCRIQHYRPIPDPTQAQHRQAP